MNQSVGTDTTQGGLKSMQRGTLKIKLSLEPRKAQSPEQAKYFPVFVKIKREKMTIRRKLNLRKLYI